LVITGIEIASYGKDLPGKPTLVDACEAMYAAAPSLRLHLGSLEPRCLTEEAVARLQKLNICPHFHLSLQSGCDATLKRMNRKYDTALFYDVVERLRRSFPGCAITTDLICGFPGETEEEFAETLAFIRRCDFAAMHVFPYSVRPGTPAAKMEQLPQKVKTGRAARAIAAAEEMELAYLAAQQGRTLSVIFETEKDGVSRGHSENYVEVCVTGTGLRGLVRNVKITGLDGKMLVGSVL
ncbi:MAG: radical SAM protein, partial [Ruminococcaceae bacterium]|nr:radical SAM protein [Oscillospiraceae bacterium]